MNKTDKELFQSKNTAYLIYSYLSLSLGMAAIQRSD